MAMMSELAHGMKVMSSDGSSLGKIIRVEPEYFLVEKGFFFPKDYSIPISLVREIRDDACWLSVSREELEREDETLRASGTRTTELRDTGATAEGEQRLSLSEEELEARKRVRDAGEVVVKKEVVTEHRQIDVPVMKEEVHVERVPATSASRPGGQGLRGGDDPRAGARGGGRGDEAPARPRGGARLEDRAAGGAAGRGGGPARGGADRPDGGRGEQGPPGRVRAATTSPDPCCWPA